MNKIKRKVDTVVKNEAGKVARRELSHFAEIDTAGFSIEELRELVHGLAWDAVAYKPAAWLKAKRSGKAVKVSSLGYWTTENPDDAYPLFKLNPDYQFTIPEGRKTLEEKVDEKMEEWLAAMKLAGVEPTDAMKQVQRTIIEAMVK